MVQPLPSIDVPDYAPTLNAFRVGQADKVEADKRALMKEAGGLAAAGNMTGAKNALYRGGDFGEARAISADQRAAAAHMQAMSDHNLTRALKGQEYLGRIADEITKSPNPQGAFDQAKQRLKGLGLNVDAVTLDQLPMLRQQGLTIQEQYTQELQKRQFDADKARADQAQSNADRSYNLQKDMFNQQSGIEERRLGQQDKQIDANEDIKRMQLDLLKQKVEAAGKPKPLTEGQSTAQAYLGEIESVNKRLEPLTADGKTNLSSVLTDKGESPLNTNLDAIATNNYTPALVSNKLLNKKEKQFLQSAEQFISVLLYKRSGAQISSEEFGRNFRIYFPQPGDDQGTLRQKADARKRVISGLRIQGGLETYGGQPGATGSTESHDAELPDGFKILGVE